MRLILFLVPRLAIAATTLFGVSLLVFLALRLLPGGFADVLLGPFATPDARALIAAQYGLDQSVPVQFFKWLGALLHGDFGISMVNRRPVLDELLRRLPVTAEIAVLTLGFALVIGVPLGVASGIASSGKGRGAAGGSSARSARACRSSSWAARSSTSSRAGRSGCRSAVSCR